MNSSAMATRIFAPKRTQKCSDLNAHPHFDASGKLALVHNGVIENYQALKDELVRDGDTNFRSETDTEVLRSECPSAFRRQRQAGARAQRSDRKLSGTQR